MPSDVCGTAERYNYALANLLDKHTPITAKTVVLRPRQPWFSDFLFHAKCARRKAERKWHISGSFIDYEEFKNARNSYNNQLYKAKCDYFNNKILDCGNDAKNLFLYSSQ